MLMIANVSPQASTFDESLNALWFANLVSQVAVKSSSTKKKMECVVDR
jgi:hypothetical protein